MKADKRTNNRAISDSPSVRSAYKEREPLPLTSDEKGALPIARRRKL
jgi:hypothetical protein